MGLVMNRRKQKNPIPIRCDNCGRELGVHDEDINDNLKRLCGRCAELKDEAQRDAALEKQWEERTGR